MVQLCKILLLLCFPSFTVFSRFLMELSFHSFAVFSSFLLFMFMVLKFARRSKSNCSNTNLLPGPRKLPLIGNMHNLIGSLPHRALRDMAKKYGPLMHLRLGEVSTLVISSSKLAEEVMKTHDVNFATRPEILAARIVGYGSTDIAFAPYGEYWRQLRKICMSELLSPRRVQTFQPIRQEEVMNLIRWILSKEGSSINLTEKIYSLTYTITSRAAVGKNGDDQDKFVAIVKELLEAAGGFNIADLYPSVKWIYLMSGMRAKLERLHKDADEILENIMHEHRKESAETRTGEDLDLVDVLLRFSEHAENGFCLTTNNIKAVTLDIFIAGIETSATTVNWGMLEMMKNPRIMDKAQAEVREVFDKRGSVDETGIHKLTYMKLVVKEILRLHPAVPLLLPRINGERCVINGYEIPAQTKVIVNAWALGRDSSYWIDAERFYPERFLNSSMDYKGTNFEYIPFGAGRRICPGMIFGIVNVEFLLAMLLYHFDWKLPGGRKANDLDMTEVFGLTVRRKDDLYLIPVPYHPSPVE